MNELVWNDQGGFLDSGHCSEGRTWMAFMLDSVAEWGCSLGSIVRRCYRLGSEAAQGYCSGP